MEFRFDVDYSATNLQMDPSTNPTEPNGFNDFESKIERDFRSHGVIFRYISGDLKLGFKDGSSDYRQLFVDAFAADGLSASITLEIYKRRESHQSWTLVFTGVAQMETLELDRDYAFIEFENNDFISKVTANFATELDLTKNKDLDGSSLTALQTYAVDYQEPVSASATTYSVTNTLVFDACDRFILAITGQSDGFWSDFFALNGKHGASVDGCGGPTLLMSGEQLLAASGATFTTSLEEILTSMQAIFNIGWSFETEYGGNQRLRVELMEDFYKNTEIVDLGAVVEFREEVFEDLVFNRINLGYETSGVGVDTTLSVQSVELHKNFTHSVPVRGVDGVYQRLSKYVASQVLFTLGLQERNAGNSNCEFDDRNYVCLGAVIFT